MRRALLRLSPAGPGRPDGRRRSSRRPALEALEERSLLSGGYGYTPPPVPGPIGPSPRADHPHAAPHRVSHSHPTGQAAHLRALARAGRGPDVYQQINLVSDFPQGVEGVDPQLSDKLLLNPWGLASSSTGPWWVSDQVTGVSTVYSIGADGGVTKAPLGVTIPSLVTQPSQGFNPLTGPTGIVFNSSTTDFQIPGKSGPVPAIFIFSTLDGSLAGWNSASTGGPTTAVVIPSTIKAPAEEFTGLAIANDGASTYLYTADPRLVPGIDVFNSSWQQVTLTGNFVDPKLPPGLSPYNIQALGGHLYVAYTAPATGGGAVAEFNPDGTFVREVAVSGPRGPLESPWALAIAPPDFGHFSNDLLVGNFGDGRISAFNSTNGRFRGQLDSSRGQPIVIPFLWALGFGNGKSAGPANVLYYTAGIAGQYHGLFGALLPARGGR